MEAAAALATVAQYHSEASAEVSKKAWNVHWNHASSSSRNQLAQITPSESPETADMMLSVSKDTEFFGTKFCADSVYSFSIKVLTRWWTNP